jgi:hypothetical protein
MMRTSGSVVGWGTMLQDWGSIPHEVTDFSFIFTYSFQLHYGLEVDSACKWVPGIFIRFEVRPARKAVDLYVSQHYEPPKPATDLTFIKASVAEVFNLWTAASADAWLYRGKTPWVDNAL